MDNQSLQLLLAFGRMLGGYGQDTGKGMDWGIPAEAMMGNIRAQGTAAAQRKWMEWFQQFLGPDESKATLSNKGITMSLPGSDLGSIFQGTQKGGVWEGMAPPLGAPSNLKGAMPQGGVGRPINPFASSLPEFSASDLAGLTPEDISSALAGPLSAVGMKQKLGLEREQLAGKSVQDVFDMMYKGQLIRESEHRVKVGTPTIPIPGTDILLTPAQYLDYLKMTENDKTAAVKNFEFAQGQGFKGDFMGFQDAARTTHKKDYDEAVSGGYKGSFNTWMLEMAKAGAINLGAKLEEKKAISELGGQTYFDDPKWSDNVEKATADYIKDTLWKLDSAARDTEATEYKVKLIEGKINAGGGQIVNAEIGKDGMGIWTVKWPSGDTKKIKYKLK
uniref:Uncharacterized protein n=1 Tax=viral metagenome TaxID=1070528 RepID=A0A6M3IEC9_9ZZZZ